ncbi:transcriptional regulator, LacI family [Friedmanniella luteola]|uniref:Transcriptional regulator, LacI family n=1 Tax=Friedmanniella luteola TaxID=546871 RepID=A0A1H1TMQ5_9ACTN|nr:LacI family DNA-binding transcriptional regulator [Friedmanniella luteola]SDS61540.1 transcriptional regulator, LacI family [Friedmanniella luteola]
MTGRPHERSRTIADVAARAGVSLSTVSRVLNGNARVDEALAAKVRAAADALDYTASPLARSLVLGRTNTVAVVVPDLENPTFHGVLRGLSRAAARDGYHVLVADSVESVEEERILAVETRRRCDGIVLCAPRMPEDDLERLLTQLQPVVLVNREARSTGTPAVTADYRSGLTELLHLLRAEGHRTLLYLAGAPQSSSNLQRLAALRAFSAEHPDVAVRVEPCGVNFAEGHDAADGVLASGATGVLAFNDLVAMGLMSALGERGVRVPDDVSVTGFDDIPFARYLTPPLTTASVPVTELGEQAWHRMAELLGSRAPGHTILFRPRLEVRGSTGPAPARTVGAEAAS